MRVVRGRAESIDADRARTDTMVERALERDEPALRAWTPHRQVAFGPRDARADSYDRARAVAREQGFVPVERGVGGRAVAYTGETVAVVYAEPGGDRTAIEARYDRAQRRFEDALDTLGVDARDGEPDRAFCPGDHSLQAEGKIVGLAQRVRRNIALVAGIVVVRNHEQIAAVLDPVYDALDIPFDPTSVGSVATAGDTADPDAVVDAFVDTYTAEAESVVQVRET